MIKNQTTVGTRQSRLAKRLWNSSTFQYRRWQRFPARCKKKFPAKIFCRHSLVIIQFVVVEPLKSSWVKDSSLVGNLRWVSKFFHSTLSVMVRNPGLRTLAWSESMARLVTPLVWIEMIGYIQCCPSTNIMAQFQFTIVKAQLPGLYFLTTLPRRDFPLPRK
jgi:hypothetical protein